MEFDGASNNCPLSGEEKLSQPRGRCTTNLFPEKLFHRAADESITIFQNWWLTPTNSKWESQRVTRTEVLWHGNSALDSLIDRTFLDPDSAVRKHFCYWERRSKLWNFQLAIYSILGDIIDLATNLVVIINSLMIFTQAWSCLCQLALLAGRAEISFQLMMGLFNNTWFLYGGNLLKFISSKHFSEYVKELSARILITNQLAFTEFQA